ncbi:SdrD B-like domain-containing protein [Phytoactinopolyspora mesophila]|uniref:SdrD B-like domain-containing protein n=1 Tax=Phytoactinopolyspora mesophila TaxID=2650750 RepID=UPI0013911E28
MRRQRQRALGQGGDGRPVPERWSAARRGTAGLSALGLLGSMLVGIAAAPAATAAEGDEITGTIWQDYDSNGMFDSYESGLAGIEVYAYDGAGNVAGPVVTDADGGYALPVTSDADQWRVEANVPDTPEWAEWRDTVVGRGDGTANGTTVQFVDVSDGDVDGVDFSFHVPTAFVDDNPQVYIPIVHFGTSDGPNADAAASGVIWWDAESPNQDSPVPQTGRVPFSEVGATNGSAMIRADEVGGLPTVFTAAYLRRHSAFGPGGIGAIYRVTPDGADWSAPNASAEVYVDLVAEGIDLGGPDPDAPVGNPDGFRPNVTSENPDYLWTRDAQAWNKVGRAGIGEIAMSPDERYLFAVNLHNRSLVRIDTGGDPSGAPVAVDEFFFDDVFTGDIRPYGVGADALTGTMYLSATDTAETTRSVSDLNGYVYSFDADAPGSLTTVLDFPLDFARSGFMPTFEPWATQSTHYHQPGGNGSAARLNQPVVAGVKVLHGDLIIPIRDLTGDVMGATTFLSGDPDDGDNRTTSVRSEGDVFIAAPNGDGTFTLENNGVHKGVTGQGAQLGHMGPGGLRYFNTGFGVANQDNESTGSIVINPSRDDGVMTTGVHVVHGGLQEGTYRLYQETGAAYSGNGAMIRRTVGNMVTAKGNGLGSASVLASAAPIEIGNYVWYDVNNDGIQDPDEDPVQGATVNLYEVAEDGTRTLVNTTVTDEKGEYYFSSFDEDYQLRTNTDYEVGIDNPDDYAEGGPLYRWYPTVPHTGDEDSVNPEENDSNGIVPEGSTDPFPFALVTTGGPGENDHSIDFGYSQISYEFDKRMVEGPIQSPDKDGTWTITYELVAENTGMIDGSYLLTDDLTGYGEGIEIVGTEVVSGPPEADGLLNADWDGIDDQRVVTDYVDIDAESTVDNGTEHIYTLTVTVALNADPETGEALVDLDQLACVPDAGPGAENTTGLFNVATMSPENYDDLVDAECSELPLVTLDKTVEVEPYVVDRENLPGVWEIVYGLTVTNETDVPTEYDLEDRLRFGSGIDIIDGSVVAENTDPGDITTRPEFDGLTDTLIVEDVPIDRGESHQYTVAVRFTIDLPHPPEGPDPSDCTLVDGEEDGTGLYNDANSSFNGYPDFDDECREVGQPSHEKTLISANPIGNGQWEVVYGIEVFNKGVAATWYDLDDELRFTDQVDIVSADVTSAPDGVVLYDPAWDGEDQLRIAEEVPLLGTADDGYAPHEYVLTVIADVPLSFELDADGNDPTSCSAAVGDPSVNTAFNNGSTLTDEAGLVEEDDACAELPSFTIDKTISDGPVSNGDGTWAITYDIVATNDGSADGEYTVTDQLRYGDGIVVEESEVITAPDVADVLDTWTGRGPEGDPVNVIAVDVPLEAGGEHLYQVEVVFSLDQDTLTEESMTCPPPGSGEYGGLANSTGLEHNDLTDTDEVCVSLGQPDLEKNLVSAQPIGAGQWEVHYDIVVRNLLPGATVYDLEDELLYGEGVEVAEAAIVSAPDGVAVRDDWDGVDQLVIAEDVALGGMNDDGYAPHVYTVRVVADVPPSFAIDEDGNSQALCQDEKGGNFENGGLNNVATLYTEGGDELVDTDCADLPSIELEKTVAGGPERINNDRHVITYELEVTNDGGASGEYVLYDQFRFGEGIEILDVRASNTAPGDIEVLDTFTGQGDEPNAAENALTEEVSIGAGATHTYEVGVLFTLDGDTLTVESAQCADEPGDGTRSGLLNVGLLDHNGHELDADACEPVEPEQPGDPDDPDAPGDPDSPDDPGDDLADTGSTVSLWLLAAGLVLVLGGVTTAGAARRRTRMANTEQSVRIDDLF